MKGVRRGEGKGRRGEPQQGDVYQNFREILQKETDVEIEG